MSNTEQLAVVLGMNYAPFITGMNTVETRLHRFGRTMTGIGSSILNKWTALAAIGALVKLTSDAAALEYQLARVSAITNATSEELAGMGSAAIEASKRVGVSAVEITSGMASLGQAGFSATEVVAAMPAVLDLATIGSLSFAEASDSMAIAIRTFSMEAAEASKVASYYAYLQSTTPTTIKQVGDAMKYVAPIAEMAGWKIEEVAAAIGILAQKGIRGSMAGTGLRGMMATLLNPTDKAQRLFKMLGVNLKDNDGNLKSLTEVMAEFRRVQFSATEAAGVFQQRQLAAFSTLMNAGPEALAAAQAALQENDDYVTEAAQKLYDTLSRGLSRLRASFTAVGLGIAGTFTEPLRNLVDNVMPAYLQRMENWFKYNTELKADMVDIFDWMIKWGTGLADYIAENVDIWYKNLKWLAQKGTQVFVDYVMYGLNEIHQFFGGPSLRSAKDWFAAIGDWARTFYNIAKGIAYIGWEIISTSVTTISRALGTFVGHVATLGVSSKSVFEGFIISGAEAVKTLTGMQGRLQDFFYTVTREWVGKHRNHLAKMLGVSPEDVQAVEKDLAGAQEMVAGFYKRVEADIDKFQTWVASRLVDTIHEALAKLNSEGLNERIYPIGMAIGGGIISGIVMSLRKSDVQGTVSALMEGMANTANNYLQQKLGESAFNFVSWAENLVKGMSDALKNALSIAKDELSVLKYMMPSKEDLVKSTVELFASFSEGFLPGLSFAGGAKKAADSWIGGMRYSIEVGAERIKNALATHIAPLLIGKSPPPKGPLRDLGTGGYKALMSWYEDGGKHALEEVGGEIGLMSERLQRALNDGLTPDQEQILAGLTMTKENMIAFFNDLQKSAESYQTVLTAVIGEHLLKAASANQQWAHNELQRFQMIETGFASTIKALAFGKEKISEIWKQLGENLVGYMIDTFMKIQMQEMMTAMFQKRIKAAEARAALRLSSARGEAGATANALESGQDPGTAAATGKAAGGAILASGEAAISAATNVVLPGPQALGGAFTVPGSGPVDSKLVAFMATPGEHVSVSHGSRDGGSAGSTVIVQVYDYRSSGDAVEVEQEEGPNGEVMLKVMIQDVIRESIDTGALDASAGRAWGVSRRGIRR